jgi:hydroxyethylthiazole kinase
MDIRLKAEKALQNIKKANPLVHNITNYVAANFQANALLAIGASPVMAHSEDEVEDIESIADALVLNIGTPSKSALSSMIRAGIKAKELGKPVILDPVGAGATKFRDRVVKEILTHVSVDIVRGNASEIAALCGIAGKTKGVDASLFAADVIDEATDFSKKVKAVVVVSGPVDYVIAQDTMIECQNGVPMLGKITGSGCAVTSIIGAFAAVEEDKTLAALFGLGLFGFAGERASKNSNGPGSFASLLIDELYKVTPLEFSKNLKFKIKRSES